MNLLRKIPNSRFAPAIVPVLILVLWQLLGQFGYISTRTLPTPYKVLEAGWALTRSGDVFYHIAISTRRAFIGLIIGGGIGLFFGMLNGVFASANKLLDSTLQMIRNVPHLALIPLVILWFGIDETAKIFLVVLGVFFPIYMNTLHGIRSIDPGLIEMARVYGLRGFALYRDVIFPGSLSSILVGFRYALGFMWLTLIVAETISASKGIGFMAMDAREFMRLDIVVFAIILYAALGKLSDSAAKLLERKWLRWNSNYVKQ